MNQQEAETIITIAALAAASDGSQLDAERARIAEAAQRLGVAGMESMIATPASDSEIANLAGRLTTEEARHAAYDTALAVCHADGWANPSELRFLRLLATALRIEVSATGSRLGIAGDAAAASASASTNDASSPATSNDGGADASTAGGAAGATALAASAGATDDGSAAEMPEDLEAYILDQAILTAALEILPDRLANIAILPLQLRLVHQIAQRHGQKMDLAQAKDLAGALGIGAAAQVMEKVVRRTLGGLAGGLLGGMFGGAAGLAAGASVTFAATYALGHAAQQYYAQGRQLSMADLKGLFVRFQNEAQNLFPKVQQRVDSVAQSTNVGSLLRNLRGV